MKLFGTTPLQLVTEVPFAASYFRAGRPGTTDMLFLHPEAHARVKRAAEALEAVSSPGHRYGLLVFDGHRAAETQRDIFDEYVHALMSTRGLGHADAIREAAMFVRSPDGFFPHGSGGVVDLTLTINGVEAWMGTPFDAFTDASARDWFDVHVPIDPGEVEAAANRRVLFTVMAASGFVGLDEEWWHFEWGTKLWSIASGRPPAFADVVPRDHVA